MSPKATEPKAPLVLVDGHALAYRMYFALEGTRMQTQDGHPTWAVYGFFMALFQLLKQRPVGAMAVAFDVSRESFRTELYADYKANRASMPDDMREQMAAILEGVEALGLPLFQIPDVEADDVIGTLTRQTLEQTEHPVEILTGDQDSFQLVDEAGRVHILIPSRKPKEGLKPYGWQEVFDKWGVYPNQVVDAKGLMGDTSDNIPGVPSVGQKTAAKLLAQYTTLDGVYENLSDLKGKKLFTTLETYKDQAYLSQKLAQIITDVPGVTLNWEACQLQVPDVEALKSFLQRYEMKAFLGQLDEIVAAFNGTNAKEKTPTSATGSMTASVSEEGHFPTFEPECVTQFNRLEKLEQLIREAGGFALDLETTALDTKTAEPVGIAIAVGKGLKLENRRGSKRTFLYNTVTERQALTVTSLPEALKSVYIPVGHKPELQLGEAPPKQLNWQDVKPWLNKLIQDEALFKLVHNRKYEQNVLSQWGMNLAEPVLDTMLLSYVLSPERRHGLKGLAEDLLGLPMKPYEEIVGKGKKQKCFSDIGLEEATQYGALDAYATLALAFTLLPQLPPSQTALLWDMELPLSRVLAEMEATGICLDTGHLATLSQQLDKDLNELESTIYDLAGEPFNLNSPKQVGEVFFDKLGIPPMGKTASKSGYSTDAKVLEKLAPDYEIVQKLLDYRQLFKLKSTYIDALPKLLHPRTKRLHTSFNQTITATGRLSSSEPNLQNIPVRTELGRKIREAFIPQQDTKTPWVLISADYSQIELRLLAHLSADTQLMEAFHHGEDIHTKTAALVLGLEPDKVSKEQRYQAKAVNFGIVYGQTAHGLSQQLDITRAEAQSFIDRYFETYPGVKTYIEEVKALAHQQGWVETLCGRRRNLAGDLASSNRSVREFAERAAFNTPIQGGAADLLKLAMLRLQGRLRLDGLQAKLLLQVHDELVLEAPRAELDATLTAIDWAMGLDQPLNVPLVVDRHIGDNWLEN